MKGSYGLVINSSYHSGLRIALLVESSSAGVGRHVIDLAEALTLAGHSVDVLYSGRRIDVRFSAGIDRVQALGATFIRMDMAHGPHPSDFALIRNIRHHLSEAGPFDLLHCHSTKAGLIGRIAAVGLSCRTIYTPHAFFTMSPSSGKLSRSCAGLMEWSLALLGHRIICCSGEELAHALELHLPQSKLAVVSNGIDIAKTQEHQAQREQMRRRFGLSEDEVCIGFVGRLFPQKNPQLLVDALSLALRDGNRSARLVMVGKGPLLPALEEQVGRLGLADRTVFAGEIEGSAAMSGFDLFALPSHYEGFPYVAVEALAMGLPIVSTAVGGAATLVRSGENGLIVPVGSTREFADALRTLISDGNLRKSMAAKSLSLVRRFSIERMLNETLAVYQQAFDSSETPALADFESI